VKRGGGGWVVGRASSQILGASFAKSADDAAQLLGQPDTGEPYTILIMGLGSMADPVIQSQRPDISFFYILSIL
jgi:hypothetical protein